MVFWVPFVENGLKLTKLLKTVILLEKVSKIASLSSAFARGPTFVSVLCSSTKSTAERSDFGPFFGKKVKKWEVLSVLSIILEKGSLLVRLDAAKCTF